MVAKKPPFAKIFLLIRLFWPNIQLKYIKMRLSSRSIVIITENMDVVIISDFMKNFAIF
jgi:hypothetical protein